MLRITTGHPIDGDVKNVDSDVVRFMADDDRCFVEVRIGRDGKSIEVSGVMPHKIDGKLYSQTLLVKPVASNMLCIYTEAD